MNEENKALPNLPDPERANQNKLYKNTHFIELLQKDIQTLQANFNAKNPNNQEIRNKTKNDKFFNVMSANDWIKQASTRPIPRMLFSEFWYESEVCILYADTNLGKSILAVQIADSISHGIPIPGFKLEAEKQKVLYFDFELTDKQFQNRYSENYQRPYLFSDNLLRIEINPDSDAPENISFEDYLNLSIEETIVETQAKVLIIDNITYLRSETEKARDALPLMKQLKALKNKYNLSLLILAHTPKRDLSKPITRNDLQGSKMLINFCDSSFSIGESFSNNSIRYIKMIKARNTEIIYDGDNVIECHICKPDNFLKFEFLNFGSENSHLRASSEEDKEELENKILSIIRNEPGISSYAIAKRLGNEEVNFNSFKVKINRLYTKLKNNQQKW